MLSQPQTASVAPVYNLKDEGEIDGEQVLYRRISAARPSEHRDVTYSQWNCETVGLETRVVRSVTCFRP